MFASVLVANRGEIAVRVMRTLRRLGIRSVAVYSDADARALHVQAADVAVRIGPPAPRDSYLNVAAILEAARQTGVDAIHPGYGFLSENADFARSCLSAGVVFVGPPPEAIEAMGDKIRAKALARQSGVAVVPGRDESGMSDAELAAAASEIGYPVLVKPSAGGGGKGMRLVVRSEDLPSALAGARREASSSFGDDTLFIERWIDRPRHIEIQVFADAHGGAIQLGERECSLQRRHQKVVEETPSPAVDDQHRGAMGADALAVARACGYVGAGTVEFIVAAETPAEHYFLEMNTRLQVEHPVTELVTGVDLVEWQLEIAAGGDLSSAQEEIVMVGHAVEARLYAEDPAAGFLPTGGQVVAYEEPTGPGVRVDSGIEVGSVIGSLYDPMLAKVCAWGETRAEALAHLRQALAESLVVGVKTNVSFLSHLLSLPEVEAGRLDTGLVERSLESFVEPVLTPEVVAAAAAGLVCELDARESPEDLWGLSDGWRLSGRAFSTTVLEFDHGARFAVRWRGRPTDLEVAVDGQPSVRLSVGVEGDHLTVRDGVREDRYRFFAEGTNRWIVVPGAAWRFLVMSGFAVGDQARHRQVDRAIRSPMPGSVVAVEVTVGDQVQEGDVLVVVEAMKMEHAVVAPHAGTVTALFAEPGDRVTMDQELAVIEALPGESDEQTGESTANGPRR